MFIRTPRRTPRRFELFFMALYVMTLLGIITFWCFVVYVAWHFIQKFW
jgi:ABC-type phosphate transport system permease subunit